MKKYAITFSLLATDIILGIFGVISLAWSESGWSIIVFFTAYILMLTISWSLYRISKNNIKGQLLLRIIVFHLVALVSSIIGSVLAELVVNGGIAPIALGCLIYLSIILPSALITKLLFSIFECMIQIKKLKDNNITNLLKILR